MPRSFRRWYRRRYGRRAYRRYRRARRQYRKYANGSSRSRLSVKIPVTITNSVTVAAGATLSDVMSISSIYDNTTRYGTAYNALIGGVFRSPLFEEYTRLYDEVKIDGMKLNFAITTAIGPGGTFPSLQVYTGVDRKWVLADYQEAYDPATGQGYPTAENIKNMSSFMSAVALNNSITKMQRSVWASDLIERSSFCDSSFNTQAQTVNGQGNQQVTQFRSVINNMFRPCFLFCVDTGSNVDALNDRVCSITVEIMYYVTFRNPKWGAANVNRARVAAVDRGVNHTMDNEQGNIDLVPEYDSDDMDDAPPPSAAAAAAAAAPVMDNPQGSMDQPRAPARHGRVVSDRSDPKLSSRPLN